MLRSLFKPLALKPFVRFCGLMKTLYKLCKRHLLRKEPFSEQLCRLCNTLKPLLGYYACNRNKSGYRSACKVCTSQLDFNRRCTSGGFLIKLKCAAKSSQYQRYKKQGLCPPMITLTTDYVHLLHAQQKGKGFYSDIPLNLRPLSDWQASLERLDRGLDYIDGNVVLEACEFNSGCQWNAEKILKIPSLICSSCNVTPQDIEKAQLRPQNEYYRQYKYKEIVITAHYRICFCHRCNDWKSSDEFYKKHMIYCRDCHKQNMIERRHTIRGFLANMLLNAKIHGKGRKSFTYLDTRKEFELTLDDIFQILIFQKFRYEYSGIPMVFEPHADWRCSLERIDPNGVQRSSDISIK